jgi:hypothetical protein
LCSALFLFGIGNIHTKSHIDVCKRVKSGNVGGSWAITAKPFARLERIFIFNQTFVHHENKPGKYLENVGVTCRQCKKKLLFEAALCVDVTVILLRMYSAHWQLVKY